MRRNRGDYYLSSRNDSSSFHMPNFNQLHTPTPVTATATVPPAATGANGAGANNNINANTAAAANNNNNTNTNANTNPNNSNTGNGTSNLELNKDITMYRAVLRNELLGTSIDGLNQQFFQTNQSGVGAATIHSSSNGVSNGQSIIATASINQQNQTSSGNGNMNSTNMANGFSSKFGSVLQPREMTSVFQVS